MNDVPPQALDAEEHVLGAILQSPSALETVADTLTSTDFYKPSHGRIYETALALHAAGEPVDLITVGAQLNNQATLAQLVALAPSTANVGHYARIVADHARWRDAIALGQQIQQFGYDRIDGVADRIQALAFSLTEQQQARAVNLPHAVRSVYDELVELDGKPRELLGVPSGLADLDRVTRGFRKGSFIVVAADTGRGKSALWLNVALHLVGRGLPVAAFSLEMSETELINRALSLDAGIPHDRLIRGELHGAPEWTRLTRAMEQLTSAPLALWTDALIRPAAVRSQLRRWLASQPDGALAVVDYLQLLVPDDKTDNRTQDVSAISRALKVTAMDLQIPIIAVSQLRRRMQNTKPHRNDLRESGSIENDADVVILIHHDENDPGIAELIVAKNRHGAEDTVRVKWTAEQMRFTNLVHEARLAA